MDFCRARVNHLRIDTHRDNGVMQYLILKHGFVPCGTIWVEDGTPAWPTSGWRRLEQNTLTDQGTLIRTASPLLML